MIQAGDWLSRTQLCRTQMWWTRSCRGFSSILQQHGQQPLSCASGLREGTCPPLLTIFKSPAEALCPVLGSPVQKGTDLHKQVWWRDTNIKVVIKGWSTGCRREEKAKEAPSSRHAGKSEGLFREVPGGKRGANRLKSAREILS